MINFPLSLGEVAQLCEGEVLGCIETMVLGIASVEQADSGMLTFVNQASFLKKIPEDSQAIYIIKPEWADKVKTGIICDNPTKAWRLLLTVVYGFQSDATVQMTAIISEAAIIGDNPSIGHYTQIADDVELGDNVAIGSHCIIGRGVKISDKTRIGHHVVIHQGCEIGHDCVIADGAIIGGQGFGFSFEGGNWEPIPQIGRVVIGNHVFVGSNTCIDCGAINDTVIQNNVIIDNLVHIAHNVVVGEHTAMAAGVGIAGSTTIGQYCLLAGQVGISGHISIADGVQINGGAKVLQSIKEPGAYAGSFHVLPARKWNRLAIYVRKLESLFKREK